MQDRTPFEWLTFAAEELGEMAAAISEAEFRGEDSGKVINEAVQTATLCLKIAEMYAVETVRRRDERLKPENAL